MAIYLGDAGSIELERNSLNVPLLSVLNTDDVNVDRRRFSFDFDANAIISGDRLEIATEGGENLELVANHVFPSGRWYVHIDAAGGCRLFDSFAAAIRGEIGEALELIAPSTAQPINVEITNARYRYIAQIQQYQITSTRETVDLTSIGEEFRRRYASGLIGGQGSLTCLWDYERGMCEKPEHVELPNYFAQLVIRTQLGASFKGRFYLRSPISGPITNQHVLGQHDDYLWYEALCIVTNVSLNFTPAELLKTQIQFVTTGEFRLMAGTPPGYLLQQDSSFLLQEDEAPIGLEDTF